MPECEHCGIDSVDVKEWMGMMLCEKCYYLLDEEELTTGDEKNGA